jgi:hypothetical protein
VNNKNKIAGCQLRMSVVSEESRLANGGILRHDFHGKDATFCDFLCLTSDGTLEVVECGQFTCYDFSVLDSDRHVAC